VSKILLVEDDVAIRRLIRDTLEWDGHMLLEASSGEAGLALAAHERPDVLLLDVMMPGGVDGLEVCRRARAMPGLASASIVIMSARGTDQDLANGTQAGCDAYLVKPFSPLQLMALIDLLRSAAGRSCAADADSD